MIKSSSFIALIALVTIVALSLGGLVYTHQHSSKIDSSVLLNAQLLLGEPSDDSDKLSNTVKQNLGQLTLVNFWATWCSPCRHEMPVFEAVYQANKDIGFNVIGIAIDTPNIAQPFLDSMGISYPILYAEKTGMDLMFGAGNDQGLLPYSLLLDKHGEIIEIQLGAINEQTLNQWIEKYIKNSSN